MSEEVRPVGAGREGRGSGPAHEHRAEEPVRAVPVRQGEQDGPSAEHRGGWRLLLHELLVVLEDAVDDVFVFFGPDGARDVDQPATGADPPRGGLEKRTLEGRPPGERGDVEPPADVWTAA